MAAKKSVAAKIYGDYVYCDHVSSFNALEACCKQKAVDVQSRRDAKLRPVKTFTFDDGSKLFLCLDEVSYLDPPWFG